MARQSENTPLAGPTPKCITTGLPTSLAKLQSRRVSSMPKVKQTAPLLADLLQTEQKNTAALNPDRG